MVGFINCRKNIIEFFFLTLVFVILNSCGWKSDGAVRLEKLYPASDEANINEITSDQADILETAIIDINPGDIDNKTLAGSWVMMMIEHGQVMNFELILTNLFMAEINEEETSINFFFCNQDIYIDSNGLGQTKMPDTLKDALFKVPIQIELPGNGTFPAQKAVWTWGIKDMEAPFNDKIPEDKDDPRVWDQDKDEQPGVTMHVLMPEGDRYMVRREIWDLQAGTLSSDKNWLSGILSYKIDEQALGASNSLLEIIAPIEPSAENNTYQLRRVNSEYTCEQLVKNYGDIFKSKK